MRLVAAKDYQATSVYIIREGCLVLQPGWQVTYQGSGASVSPRSAAPGDPDVFFAPNEAIQ